MPGFRTLARNRDFSILWAAQTISELGTRVSGFVFPLLGFALSGSAFWAATAEAAQLLGIVVMLLPAGLLADRFDRARLMRFAAVLGLIAYGSLAAAGAVGRLTLTHLIVAALVAGIGAGLFTPAEASAVRTLVSEEGLPVAYSQIQAREHIASLLGGPVGGALYGLTRWLPFVCDAVSYALMWAMLGRLRTPLPGLAAVSGGSAVRGATQNPQPPATASAHPRRPTRSTTSAPPPWRRGPLDEIAAGLRFSWSTPFFRVLLIWSPLMNLVGNALALVAILRLVQAGVTPGVIALVEVASGLAGIVGAVIAPWLIEHTRTGMLSVVLGWCAVPMVIPLAIWNSPAVVAAMMALILVVNPAGNAGIGAYRTAITPPELLGRTQSAMRFVAMAAMPLAPVLAGALLTRLGGSVSVLALGAMLAAVAMIPTLSRSVRSVPRPALWRVGAVHV